jgi:DNA-binding YbaB/EbfC family protein
MFDALKNLGNLPELMRKAQEMQSKMKEMQEEMARRTVQADAGGGMVTATVNGRLEVTAIKIDKSRVDVNDVEMLEDVIVSAIRAAQAKAAAEMATEMHKLAGGLGLPPGVLPNP